MKLSTTTVSDYGQGISAWPAPKDSERLWSNPYYVLWRRHQGGHIHGCIMQTYHRVPVGASKTRNGKGIKKVTWVATAEHRLLLS